MKSTVSLLITPLAKSPYPFSSYPKDRRIFINSNIACEDLDQDGRSPSMLEDFRCFKSLVPQFVNLVVQYPGGNEG